MSKVLQQLREHTVPFFTMNVEQGPQIVLDIAMPKGLDSPPDIIEQSGVFYVKVGQYATQKKNAHHVGKFWYRRVDVYSI